MALAVFGFAVCLMFDASFGWWLLGFICLILDDVGSTSKSKSESTSD